MAVIPNRRFFSFLLLSSLFAVSLLAGCAIQPTRPIGQWVGPTQSVPVQMTTTHYTDCDYTVVSTTHYRIISTMTDRAFLTQVAEMMEGAYTVYQSIVPGVPPTHYPMICYLFATRAQWDSFTKQHLGPDSAVYLHIHQGGYTVYDRYVAYYFGDGPTCSVAAHEGWHQYVARHFRGRLPPFIEEGIATSFEGVQFVNGLPRFNLSINEDRDVALRNAIDDNTLWPLRVILQMHAGMVVVKNTGSVMAWYAQAWAFARFLWDGEGGKYRPAFQRMLLDIARGTVWDPSGSFRSRIGPWVPEATIPMLVHYLGVPFSQIDDEYNRYIHTLAYDELIEQSESPPQ
ncbi:MAG TPA: hypothetical protein VMD30_02455 [Tepidisphaeraceae bacterium]|nr:hypothetical protein [Tepidisphaeraceae bacterium]